MGLPLLRNELIPGYEAFDVFLVLTAACTLHVMTLGSVGAFFVGLLGLLHFISLKLKQLDQRKTGASVVVE